MGRKLMKLVSGIQASTEMYDLVRCMILVGRTGTCLIVTVSPVQLNL